MLSEHAAEVSAGSRFSFGENWTRFLSVLTEDRILVAERSLCEMLGRNDLRGLTFLDIGSGSGLFSLAARRLGASVRSFDYDPASVACTEELRRRYFPADPEWIISAGSVLDQDFLATLGESDIVYSWGVLHHTGQLWKAVENASNLVAASGQLFIAIYNDQGGTSRAWLAVKRAYNRFPSALRWLVVWPAAVRLWGPTMCKDLVRGQPFHTWRRYARLSTRGMSPWRDVIDWVGGLPFEVATPAAVREFCAFRGLLLVKLRDVAPGHGCNEFVFDRTGPRPTQSVAQ
jgi:SAM-dependent methyltransferase